MCFAPLSAKVEEFVDLITTLLESRLFDLNVIVFKLDVPSIAPKETLSL